MVAARRGGAPLELIGRTPSTAEENLALDVALLRRLDQLSGDSGASGEALRFWSCDRPVVVLGRSGRADEEVKVPSCGEAGVPILRRASGGGTVVLGPGCLSFSLVLGYAGRPALRDVAASYAIVLGRVARGLGIPGLARRGVCDLVWRGRKVSGNAQLRGRHGLVHHGTLLHDFDPALPSRFLHEPRRQPRYRRRRAHAAFIGNLPLAAEALMTRLAEAWDARPPPSAMPRSSDEY
ncbi:MAG TPA: lipoate--protein ligase family protein [Vicinamibacteria bacterium]|nr:lipoate--protein ligase family protein [Vicinamibacteria bacterium]